MLLLAAPSSANTDTLTFGVVPQQAASKLARLWAPIIQHIAAKSGQKVVFKTAPDIPTFEKRLAAGEYDLAYMNPYHYVVFSQAPGYQAFAKQKNKKINGILVSKKGSPINTIADLEGAELAFPSPAAFAASIIPRAYLKQQGIKFTAKYVSSHDSVYQNVSRGHYFAGGGIIRTLRNTATGAQEKLNVLWTSPGFTPHAFAAHPRVSADAVGRIRDAFVSMADDAKSAELLGAIKFKGIEAAETADWDDVRALNLHQLDQFQ